MHLVQTFDLFERAFMRPFSKSALSWLLYWKLMFYLSLDGRDRYSQKDSQHSADEPGQEAISVLGYGDDTLLAVRACHTSRSVCELWRHGDDHWNGETPCDIDRQHQQQQQQQQRCFWTRVSSSQLWFRRETHQVEQAEAAVRSTCEQSDLLDVRRRRLVEVVVNTDSTQHLTSV